jgi:SIS domain
VTGEFLGHLQALLHEVQETQREAFAAAADQIAGTLQAAGLVQLFGSGHSVIPVMDAFPRYGSFVGFNPLMDPRLMWSSVLGPGGVRELLWLEQIIAGEQPDVVITHGPGSFHRDHAACHEIVSEAVFYAGLADLWPGRPRHIVQAVYFAENWEDKRDFAADLYIDTSRGHATWLQALRCYELFRGGLSTFPMSGTTRHSRWCEAPKAERTMPRRSRYRLKLAGQLCPDCWARSRCR